MSWRDWLDLGCLSLGLLSVGLLILHVGRKNPAPSSILQQDYLAQEARIMASLAPKPFTPNKYTRYIPTLDGQCVPVDVYCVSEAFPLANCLKSQGAVDAVNHARKKLLAPGQRGAKSSIQDVKEAHASLGRAIEIEEAALGREGKES